MSAAARESDQARRAFGSLSRQFNSTPAKAGQATHTSATMSAPQPAATAALRDGDIHLGDVEPGPGRISATGPAGLSLAALIAGRMLIQGISGAGKSWTLRRILEQTAGKIQQIVIDPEGEFAELSAALGHLCIEAQLLDVAALGAVAARAREHRLSIVLDLSELDREAQMTASAAFLTALVAAPNEHWHPCLVAIDEAHLFAPFGGTVTSSSDTRKSAIGAMVDLMSRGRKRGLAAVLATMRLARLAKSVTAEAQNFMIGLNTLDLDIRRAAETIGWDARKAFDRLPLLAPGQFVTVGPAFASSPALVKVGPVATPHRGAAPDLSPPPARDAAAAAEAMGLDALMASATAAADTKPVVTAPAVGFMAAGRRGRAWQAGEDAIVIEGYRSNLPVVEIAEKLAVAGFRRRCVSGISARAHALGLVSARAARKWSEAEDKILVEAYAREIRHIDIVGLLAEAGYSRGRMAVQMRAIALGLTSDRVNYWTEPEKKIAIAGLEEGKPHREIIAELRTAGFERGVTSILKFSQKHNFCRKAESWTPEDIEILRSRYTSEPPVPPREIALELGKTQAAIRTKASQLGLKQRHAWSDEERRLLIEACENGRTLIDAAALIGRPYPNVASIASRMGLSFKRIARPTAGGEA